MTQQDTPAEGFSLIEVLVAVLVLGVAVAGAAGLFTVAVASTRTARVQTTATLLALDKLERLRGLAWTYEASGARVSDLSSDVSRDPPAPAGAGLSASPADALDRNTSGYVDYLDGSGQWVGTGVSPPPGAVFLRRWSIQPLPVDGEDSLILHVLVAPVAGATLGTMSGRRVRVRGDALLASVRTRVGG